MGLQKQKTYIKNLSVSLRQKPLTRKLLLWRTPALLVLVTATFVVIVFLPPAPAQTRTTKTTPREQQAKQAAKSKKPAAAKPAPAAPAPAAPPAPAPAPTPTPKRTPAPAPAGTSKVQPVVTPSPSASVSGLTPASTPVPSGGTQVTTGYLSTNWAGYFAANATFTGISGSWHATNPTGNGSTTTADSTWIGIGGVTSGDLIQVGTQNIIDAAGNVSTSAFYEMLPAYSQPVPGMIVAPGDSMSASISRVGGSQWTITISDNTRSESYSITVSYASSLSSAEWIEEDPSYSFTQQIPFDNFSSAYFTGGTTVANGVTVTIASSTAQPVIMVDNGGNWIAVPSMIGADGGSFSVTP